eukprot:1182369-Prorocentrum_minimum.AAC.3
MLAESWSFRLKGFETGGRVCWAYVKTSSLNFKIKPMHALLEPKVPCDPMDERIRRRTQEEEVAVHDW